MRLKRPFQQAKCFLYLIFVLIIGFYSFFYTNTKFSSNNITTDLHIQDVEPSNNPWTKSNSKSALLPKASFQTILTPTFVGYTYWHNNDGYSKHSGTEMRVGYDYDFWNEAWRGYTEFDLSSIPDSSIILSVSIQFEVTGSIPECDSQNAQVLIFNMTHRPSTSDKVVLYNDAGDGENLYASAIVMSKGYYPDAASLFTLNNEAKLAFQNALKQDWFAFGFIDESVPEIDEGIEFHISQLKVEYTSLVDDIYDISPNDNDHISNATIIQSGVIENLRCMDDDFYKISVNQQALLRLNVSFYRPDGNLNVTIYDPYFQPVVSLTDNRTDIAIKMTYCVKSQNTGWYYIGVTKLETKNNSYSLSIGFGNCTQSWSPIDIDESPDVFFIDVIPYIVIVIVICIIINVVHSQREKAHKIKTNITSTTPITSSSESPFVESSTQSKPKEKNKEETHFEKIETPEKSGPETTCPFCGSTIRKNATFCHYCGTKFD